MFEKTSGAWRYEGHNKIKLREKGRRGKQRRMENERVRRYKVIKIIEESQRINGSAKDDRTGDLIESGK